MIENVKTGSLADGAAFSFYPGKVLGAAGDAGAVVINHSELSKKIRVYCDHGRSEKYLHETAGINSRMDSLQAAVLNVKLKYLDGWVKKRNEIAELYFKELQDVPGLTLPQKRENTGHAWHLFVVRHPRRDELADFLLENGVETGKHYPVALPEQPVFRNHIYTVDFKAVRYSYELLSLPMGEHLTIREIEMITSLIKKFAQKTT